MPETRDKVIRFLRNNIGKTVRSPSDSGGTLRHPYTVPSVGDGFRNFFYWDTYFANWALYAMDMTQQAKNNLMNMSDLINKYGYMPNADVLTNRSQPPLFIRAVYEYCEKTGDSRFAADMLPSMRTEYAFWMRERIAPCGLNRYGASATDRQEIASFNLSIAKRLKLDNYAAREDDLHLLASAESGWDFSSRFFDGGTDCRSLDICPVDLNSILYDAEVKLAHFESLFGKSKAKFVEAAERRKSLMRKYMYRNGLYYDCYAGTGEPRTDTAIHAGSFFVSAFGVNKDCGVKKLYKELVTDNGVFTCGKSEYSKRFQWDYPMMWPPLAGVAEMSLRESGEDMLAENLRTAYMQTVERVFEQTGNLWEKYNVDSCDVGQAAEYETPPMLGWTAGVYLRFTEIQNKREGERG